MEAQRGTSTARTKRGDGEIARFKEALKRLGPSDNGKLAEAVGTRDISQVTAFKSRFLKAYPTWLTDNYHPEQPATTASSSRCSSRVPPVPRPPGQGLPTKGVRELGVPHPPLHRQQPPPPPPPRGYVIRHHSPYGQGHRKGALWGRGRPANADPVAYASHTPSHSGRGDPITTPCATLGGNNPEAPACQPGAGTPQTQPIGLHPSSPDSYPPPPPNKHSSPAHSTHTHSNTRKHTYKCSLSNTLTHTVSCTHIHNNTSRTHTHPHQYTHTHAHQLQSAGQERKRESPHYHQPPPNKRKNLNPGKRHWPSVGWKTFRCGTQRRRSCYLHHCLLV